MQNSKTFVPKFNFLNSLPDLLQDNENMIKKTVLFP